MRLADDEITITIEGDRLHLRPTLRAAYRLERRHGGFDAIVRAIADGNVTVLADVIRESSDRFTTVPDFLDRLRAPGLKIGLEALQIPVLAHVMALAGVDENGKEEKTDEKRQAQAKRMTFTEHHQKLFEIATGWLGWSPAQAWDATPAEILAAYKGRLDMLKAIFGGGEEEKPKLELSLYDKANLIFGGMKRTVVELPAEEPHAG